MPPVNINQTGVPQVESVKYLGIHFDRRLTWKAHVSSKRKQLDLKTREIKWIIGRHSPLSHENKILIYKTILKPVWTYGIELWVCASNSNTEIINDINPNYSEQQQTRLGTSPTILFTQTCTSPMSERFSWKGSQTTALQLPSTPTPSWHHHYAL